MRWAQSTALLTAVALFGACAIGAGDSDRSASGDDGGAASSTASSGSGGGSNGTGASTSTGASSSSAGGSATTTTTASVGGSGGATTSAGVGGAGGSPTGTGGMGGAGNGDLWIEIEYGSNSTPTSPSWDDSMTSGWPLQQWATSNASWPEVWDPLQGMTTNFDPMGYWAAIIDGEHLQLMIGLQSLISYTDAKVRLEGRGYSTNASAQIDVYNPLNNCGVSTSMAHDWSLHVVEVSIGQCLVTGGGVQAIRVEPTSQGLALHRMRLTIEGAIF